MNWNQQIKKKKQPFATTHTKLHNLKNTPWINQTRISQTNPCVTRIILYEIYQINTGWTAIQVQNTPWIHQTWILQINPSVLLTKLLNLFI